jgi:HPt (histidine-containing phosphotransfer) domain-containing protein
VSTSPAPFTLARAGNALDLSAALDGVDGDLGFLEEILGLFLQDVPTQMRDARAALSAGALDRVARAAHTLRGTGAQLGAHALAAAALELERSATAGLAHAVPGSLAILENAVADLYCELEVEIEPISSAA